MHAHEEVVVTPDSEQALVKELAETVLAEAAPEELALFEETAQEYFQNPERVLRARGADEPVGFGLDIAMLTPYVLAVVTPVVSFLVSTVADSAKEEMKPRVAALVRRLFRRGTESGSEQRNAAQPLTPEQARQVRQIAYQRATTVGLPEPTAALLADSVVGGILVSG
jgi:hypothetical protein